MKSKRQKIRRRLVRGGRLVGKLAWQWVKQQPPVQKKIHQVEQKIAQGREQLKDAMRLAEEEFWAWVKQLEAESSIHRQKTGPTLNECYQILGISSHASWQEIKKAWREQMRTYHPDQFAQYPHKQAMAEEKARVINEAFQRLKIYHQK